MKCHDTALCECKACKKKRAKHIARIHEEVGRAIEAIEIPTMNFDQVLKFAVDASIVLDGSRRNKIKIAAEKLNSSGDFGDLGISPVELKEYTDAWLDIAKFLSLYFPSKNDDMKGVKGSDSIENG